MKPVFVPSSLSAKLLVGLAAGLLFTSVLFLLLFLGIYREQLARERGLVSEQVNRLLQASLQNAMLKRDLPGLEDIVTKLGRQPGIAGVMIVNPDLEVRFASSREMLGRRLAGADLGCSSCSGSIVDLAPSTRQSHGSDGSDVMRSVNPIRNQPECQTCHGNMAEHPVNGILVVDQSTMGLEESALRAAAAMAGVGGTVVMLTLLGAWSFMNRVVVQPVERLEKASRALAGGNLDTRVGNGGGGSDEIASLCNSFNAMASSLRASVEDVREKEHFLQAVMNTVPDGVRVIDDNYRVVMANETYGNMTGTKHDKAVTLSCFAARGLAEPCAPTLTTCPFHALTDKEPTLRYMHEIKSADGTEILAEISASRLSTERAGRTSTYIVEVLRDAHQQVRFSHSQRLSEIGQLATGVAHEIYNPLSSVRLGLKALDKRLAKIAEGDDEAAEYLRIVNSQIDRCMEVTERLLDLSHLPSSNIQLVSFTNIVPEVLSLLRFDAERIGITVDVDLGDTELRVFATDSELRMLILNLAQNGFHAMPKGGRLVVRGRQQAGVVSIEIADDGVGIAAENLSRIFDPFFTKRADDSQGSGLGLTICRAIVARYGGRLDARSIPGEGATFTISLPAAGANAGGEA